MILMTGAFVVVKIRGTVYPVPIKGIKRGKIGSKFKKNVFKTTITTA